MIKLFESTVFLSVTYQQKVNNENSIDDLDVCTYRSCIKTHVVNFSLIPFINLPGAFSLSRASETVC